ncbi:MAG: glucan biosynthesis glucosyltransferase H, partial [Hyphomicrobiales bacterium]|nr:glucan biosynthesis glucosyltransferase H [Hyphomicrobiales bacterium]
ATRAEALAAALDAPVADALDALAADPALRAAHEAMLPADATPPRGTFETARALAEAKVDSARTRAELKTWLARPERMAVALDRALISIAMRLPAA